jgi:uncharacterized phage protein (TIGR02218 family)
MKGVTSTFINNEEAIKKKPVELYHFWRDGTVITHWRYTSGDVAVTYPSGGAVSYVPATLQRGIVSWDEALEVTKMEIQAGYIEDPVFAFVASNPVEKIWVEVMRLHRDQVPLEADVIFLGQVSSISFKGVQGNISCVGFEHYLGMSVPKWRYQIPCNWKLFETLVIGAYTFGCRKVKADYKVSPVVVTLDSTKTILTSATFDLSVDGYFTYGSIEFGDEKRAIVYHVGTTVYIAYPMSNLVGGNSVAAYPGCDGSIATCRDKFSNINNFFGFPYIPEDNPALRTQ